MKLSKSAAAAIASCMFMTLGLSSCKEGYSINSSHIRYGFRNLIDVTGVPDKAEPDTNYEINPFSDMGAWHAYHLPGINDKDYYGGFTGPLYIAQEYGLWLSKCFNRIRIYNGSDGREISLSDCRNPELSYYPGLLVQEYDMEGFVLRLELRFVTNRTALVTTKIKNKSREDLALKLNWDGELLKYNKKDTRETLDMQLEACADGIKVKFPDAYWKWNAFTSHETEYEVRYPIEVKTSISGNGYNIETDKISIKQGSEYVLNTTNTYTFTLREKSEENKKIADIFKDSARYIKENDLRWEKYLSSGLKGNNHKYDRAVVKAIETLVTNWRSPAGAIKRDGITPSMSYKWFNGMWAWDSWKHAAAVSSFAPELAKDSIRTMFDYQKDDGMIIDAVFYNRNGGNWNERNSKPPLAAWAVWKIYEASGDRGFLNEMYPKLVKYHDWWYTARDNDRNGIAEYGAAVDSLNNNKEEQIRAAAWESGMDNAVRFDMDYGVEMLESRDGNGRITGCSVNQESVDLNSYLYAEKKYLGRIAEVLNNTHDRNKYEKEASYVKSFIENNMFDENTGFFYDIDIETKKPLVERGKGVEGFIPLWAGAASKKQAEGVKNISLDEGKFNTFVPFPTASKDNVRYNPVKYWRGPVWLDQAYFAVEGLRNYGYADEAVKLAEKIINNADGILVDGEVIRENYDPESGQGLHCTNFSWSAGMIYLLCREYL